MKAHAGRNSHIPPLIYGEVDKLEDFGLHPWIQQLQGRSVFVSLGTDWPFDTSRLPLDHMPRGYKYYIFSGDSVMIDWIEQMSDYLQAPVIYLCLPKTYGFKSVSPHAHFFPFTFLHKMCQRLQQINTEPIAKDIKYKVSALTNRITQSKAITFSAIKKYLDDNDCLVSLNTQNLTAKNVHNWEPTGNALCDEMMSDFAQRWKNQILTIDDFFSSTRSDQQNDINHPAYSQAALNFTQESYHYSYHHKDGREYISPGPFLTEKTLKCLLSATAFISTSQFDVYGFLSQAGMKFDYGAIDLTYDQDPGNLTRLAAAVKLIQGLQQWSAQDLYEMTRGSCQHNQQVVLSGDFYRYCESQNQRSVEQILELIG